MSERCCASGENNKNKYEQKIECWVHHRLCIRLINFSGEKIRSRIYTRQTIAIETPRWNDLKQFDARHVRCAWNLIKWFRFSHFFRFNPTRHVGFHSFPSTWKPVTRTASIARSHTIFMVASQTNEIWRLRVFSSFATNIVPRSVLVSSLII